MIFQSGRIPHAPTRRKALRLAVALCLPLSLFLASACARQKTLAAKPLRTTILIMDFEVPKEFKDNPNAIEGWWLGSHSRIQNPNAGKLFAEVLTREMRLAMGDWADLPPRLQVRQYFAKKRALLDRQFGKLRKEGQDAEEYIDGLMAQVSPLDFARELGADKVLVGKMLRSKMYINRVIKIWSSTVEVECALLDVESGKTLWTYHHKKTGRLDSAEAVMEKMARRLAARMTKEYFMRPPAEQGQ